ncbi:MAG: cytochrome c oxidase accessory protein CcoG [Phycisphaerales bacterium]
MTQAPNEQVLSTLNRDGSRRWLDPKISPGRFWRRRRVVGFGLIALFVALPWIPINGKPAVLLDLPAREFTILGATFLPTDTLLFGLLMASVFVAIFLMTALFGRIWCGWACPQTVYMEFVFRPIERFFLGRPTGNKGQHPAVSTGRRLAMYATYLLICLLLAHVFLSYFIGTARLFDWMQQSPLEHPRAFLIVAAVTAMMMFDFAFFREQLCIVACPYGRLQSVLLDRQSKIVAYDEQRGEPRGRATARTKQGLNADQDAHADVGLPVLGDCVDCTMCVQVCPTGIDIRKGLQMECVNCTQCMDACDAVMSRLKRPLGLIRYSSQDEMERGERKLLRPRVVIYPALLAVLLGLFAVAVVGRKPVDVTLLRAIERPYLALPTGEIENSIRINLVNRTDERRTYTFAIDDLDGAELRLQEEAVVIEPGATRTVTASIVVPREAFSGGFADCRIRVEDDTGFVGRYDMPLQGPSRRRATSFHRPDDHSIDSLAHVDSASFAHLALR